MKNQSTSNIDNPTCFVSDTPIWTAAGFKPISAVQAGDDVLAFNYAAGRWILSPVIRVISRPVSDDIVEIATNHDVIYATGDHPFAVLCHKSEDYRETSRVVASRFAAASGVQLQQNSGLQTLKWVAADQIQSGDELVSRSVDYHEIYACRQVPYRGKVFDLVTGTATYSVGLSQTLVHCRSLA